MPKAHETRFYQQIETWLQIHKGCTSTKQKHRIGRLSLLEIDVVGFTEDELRYACEVKNYPFPVGSNGYGAVGQALACRRHVPLVYIACCASEHGDNSWHRVMQRRSILALLKHIEHPPGTTFDDYFNASRAIFDHFFGNLGIGLLVVHEDASEDASGTVHELREPSAHRPS